MPKKLKILYALQGTGNGHAARALEIIPLLKNFAKVDILISGSQSQVKLNEPIQHTYRGVVFYYSKRGGVNYLKTLFNNSLISLFKELNKVPIRDYDLVINDFEAISAWACKLRKVPIIGLSHQASFLSDKTPRPAKKDWLGELILRYYAPVEKNIGFHFKPYDNFIFPPVIRADIRQAILSNLGHYTVYLPAYADDKLIKILLKIEGVSWQLFSRKAKEEKQEGNVLICPIDAKEFAKSITSSAGLLCSAGFEGPSEALFLGKKLFVVPIKGQYEQYCNAAALNELGVPSLKVLNEQSLEPLRDWLQKEQNIQIDFPDQTKEILEREVFATSKLGT
ncbi:MAG: glycosyl transferase [Bacteroidetes bacterium]|nr:MAG: glycosyl transferase [Bacteroidota bacterium]